MSCDAGWVAITMPVPSTSACASKASLASRASWPSCLTSAAAFSRAVFDGSMIRIFCGGWGSGASSDSVIVRVFFHRLYTAVELPARERHRNLVARLHLARVAHHVPLAGACERVAAL